GIKEMLCNMACAQTVCKKSGGPLCDTCQAACKALG
uniref:Turgencin-B n=1 Tax=Synoicum turgens TaxID=2697470 RepID=TURB_SYNTU|nr:RecName: Full=Turgencin-B [Synoicum turgens]